jgi:hypothetical protein
MSKVAVVLLVSLALAWTAAGKDEPLTEAAYATSAKAWHRDWHATNMTPIHNHERCVASWQHADAIRERMVAVEPPASRADYHAALMAFVEAYLETMDTCVGNLHITPEWRGQLRVVSDRRRTLIKLVASEKLDLPARW